MYQIILVSVLLFSGILLVFPSSDFPFFYSIKELSPSSSLLHLPFSRLYPGYNQDNQLLFLKFYPFSGKVLLLRKIKRSVSVHPDSARRNQIFQSKMPSVKTQKYFAYITGILLLILSTLPISHFQVLFRHPLLFQ